MRLLDLQLSVERQLRGLPYPAYLLAMSVIGRQLQESYADLLAENGDLLARQTVDAVTAAYLSGEVAKDEAWQLHRRWEELIEDPATDGPLGVFSAVYVWKSGHGRCRRAVRRPGRGHPAPARAAAACESAAAALRCTPRKSGNRVPPARRKWRRTTPCQPRQHRY